MGIIIDLLFLVITIASAYLGYKKGLIKMGVQLLASILAVVVMLVSYKPITNYIIENTQIDDKIQQVIIENSNKKIDNNTNISTNKYIQNTADNMTNQFKETTLTKYANTITENIISIIISLVIFVLTKVILTFIKELATFVAKLPILKQFNKIGGAVYGVIRGLIIICLCVFALEMISKFTTNKVFDGFINSSIVTKSLLNITIENY